jgi:hypothetical protein
MLPPMLGLLVAGTVHWTAEVRVQDGIALAAVEIFEGAAAALQPELEGLDAAPERAGIPESGAAAVPPGTPERRLRVTYDWRSPVVFDFP